MSLRASVKGGRTTFKNCEYGVCVAGCMVDEGVGYETGVGAAIEALGVDTPPADDRIPAARREAKSEVGFPFDRGAALVDGRELWG